MTTSFPTLAALNREWIQLDLASPAAVADWARIEPALAGCGDLSEVLVAAQQRPDDVFAALLRLGANGVPLAHRVILQSLLGLLVRLAKGHPELFEEAVGEAWLLIAEYPLARRPRSIVANLAWSLRRWARAQGAPPPPTEVLPMPIADKPDPDAAATLARARDLGLIDQLTHRTLSLVYLSGRSSAQAGSDLGLSAQAVRWRCSNALRNLNRQAALLAG